MDQIIEDLKTIGARNWKEEITNRKYGQREREREKRKKSKEHIHTCNPEKPICKLSITNAVT